jgi:hypothetical protein
MDIEKSVGMDIDICVGKPAGGWVSTGIGDGDSGSCGRYAKEMDATAPVPTKATSNMETLSILMGTFW